MRVFVHDKPMTTGFRYVANVPPKAVGPQFADTVRTSESARPMVHLRASRFQPTAGCCGNGIERAPLSFRGLGQENGRIALAEGLRTIVPGLLALAAVVATVWYVGERKRR